MAKIGERKIVTSLDLTTKALMDALAFMADTVVEAKAHICRSKEDNLTYKECVEVLCFNDSAKSELTIADEHLTYVKKIRLKTKIIKKACELAQQSGELKIESIEIINGKKFKETSIVLQLHIRHAQDDE